MRKLLTAAAIVALGLPMAAGAATTLETGFANGGGFTAGVANGKESEFAFIWDEAPASGYVIVTADNSFDLIFESYIPSGQFDPNRRTNSGLIVVNADTGERFTETTGFCDSDNVLEAIRGTCSTMSGEYSLSNADYKPDGGNNTPIMTLAAGSYYIGFYEDSAPATGFATFRTVEVPLPAGGLLLLTALGGAAMVRRRRSKT